MVIQHSQALLEQLTEIEEKIQALEGVMEKLGIELDREKLLKIITGQKMKNLKAGEH